MKLIWILILLLLVFVGLGFGQNLVPNGSFELKYSCPTTTGQVDTCIGWHRVANTPYDFCSPDYFDTCANYPVSIPNNFGGSQLAFDGNAYMGLYTYIWYSFYREIIGAQLNDTLVPGNVYHISMRVSRGNWTQDAQNQTASNKLGIRFTTYNYTNVDTPAINNFAQVYTDSIIEDTVNWVLLEWNYVADSAFNHIYIGNFFDDAHTDTVNIGWTYGQAYYFIDSVSIVCISPGCLSGINENENHDLSIFYNNENETIHTKGLVRKQNLILYDETGQIVVNRIINNNEEVNITGLRFGFYVAVLRSAEKTVYKKIIKF